MGKSGKKNTRDVATSTPLQKEMLFHYLQVPASNRYVEQSVLILAGETHLKCLREIPFRVLLCKVSDRDYRMIINNHHMKSKE